MFGLPHLASAGGQTMMNGRNKVAPREFHRCHGKRMSRDERGLGRSVRPFVGHGHEREGGLVALELPDWRNAQPKQFGSPMIKGKFAPRKSQLLVEESVHALG